MSRSNYYNCLIFILCILSVEIKAQWVNTNMPANSILLSGGNLYTTYSGVNLSTNDGTSWVSLGEIGPQCLAIDGNNIFAGTLQGVFLTSNNGVTWQAVNNGLPSLKEVFSILISDNNLLAGLGQSKGLYLSTNNGANWSLVNSIPTAAWIWTLVKNDSIVLAGTSYGVYISYDNGLTWTKILGTDARAIAVKGDYIFASRYTTSSYNRGIYISTDKGQNWSTTVSTLSNLNIVSLALSGNNIIAGTAPSSVYVSPNNGISWLSIGLVLSGTSVFSLGENNTYLFAATQGKLWRRLLSDIVFPQCIVKTISTPSNGGLTIGDGTYNFANPVTVTATPATGYTFINWSEGSQVVSTNTNYTFTIDGDKTLTAKFSFIPNPPVATIATSITQTSFKANWNVAPEATGYYLDIAIDEQFNNILSTFNNKNVANVTTYQVTGLTPSTTYYYRVRSFNSLGVSPNSSNIISIKTLLGAPSAPIATAATNKTQTSFTANWNSENSATGYYIDIAIDQNFVNKLTNYNNKDVGNVTSLEVSGLASNITYYYRVRAFNSGGTSTNSNTIVVNLTSDVEQIENGKPTSFKLFQNYPNPFNPSTKIQFSLPKYVVVRLSIYNTLGQEIAKLVNQELSAGTYSIDFDASKLNNGIYFYKIQAGEFSTVKKMVLLK